ncbi:hypothetical protein [Variovorax terrae]|uniref:Uncharacterized protein n=1 Tax=Variovorax terrae TaxID=2923278 RepID=A0A9X1VZ24_9BURK|nr:hypothetical protein [Variovorax terrae]MCJ0765519.1 hypothetical protein [Variovorax terrae]
MTSFVHTHYPLQHPGVARMESAVGTVRQMGQRFDSAKGLAAMLLAAIVSALLVVASRLVDTWTDGHLLAAWVLLWAVGFAALALFAGTARLIARRLVTSLDAWSHRVAQQRADKRLWAIARNDPRVMADLQAARLRSEAEAEIEEAAVASRLQASVSEALGARLLRAATPDGRPSQAAYYA